MGGKLRGLLNLCPRQVLLKKNGNAGLSANIGLQEAADEKELEESYDERSCQTVYQRLSPPGCQFTDEG